MFSLHLFLSYSLFLLLFWLIFIKWIDFFISLIELLCYFFRLCECEWQGDFARMFYFSVWLFICPSFEFALKFMTIPLGADTFLTIIKELRRAKSFKHFYLYFSIFNFSLEFSRWKVAVVGRFFSIWLNSIGNILIRKNIKNHPSLSSGKYFLRVTAPSSSLALWIYKLNSSLWVLYTVDFCLYFSALSFSLSSSRW